MMFRQRLVGLDLLDLRKIENKPVTLVFSRKNSFSGGLQPTRDPVTGGFKFIFRKEGDIHIYVCTDLIFGLDALPIEQEGISPLFLRKLLNGAYKVKNFSRETVLAEAYSPITGRGYSELKDYLNVIRGEPRQ